MHSLGYQGSYYFSRYSFSEFYKFSLRFAKNVAYTPILNPVERYFSILKSYYKRLRLQKIVSNSNVTNLELIVEASKKISNETIRVVIEPAIDAWCLPDLKAALAQMSDKKPKHLR